MFLYTSYTPDENVTWAPYPLFYSRMTESPNSCCGCGDLAKLSTPADIDT